MPRKTRPETTKTRPSGSRKELLSLLAGGSIRISRSAGAASRIAGAPLSLPGPAQQAPQSPAPTFPRECGTGQGGDNRLNRQTHGAWIEICICRAGHGDERHEHDEADPGPHLRETSGRHPGLSGDSVSNAGLAWEQAPALGTAVARMTPGHSDGDGGNRTGKARPAPGTHAAFSDPMPAVAGGEGRNCGNVEGRGGRQPGGRLGTGRQVRSSGGAPPSARTDGSARLLVMLRCGP